MRNRKMVLAVLIGTLVVSVLSAKNYNLNERDSIDLSGIDEVVFNLRGVSCSLCVRTAEINSELRGDGSGGNMSLALTGRMSSNRSNAVPSLIVDRTGKKLTVRLFPERETFFGLSQSGTVSFAATLPAGFSGRVSAEGSSDDIMVAGFNLEDLDIRSSSGNLEVRNVRSGTVSLTVSSGNFIGSGISADGDLQIDSSSGNVDLEDLKGGRITVKASSGRISVGNMESSGDLDIKASSGDISADSLAGGSVSLESSSGKITIEELNARTGRIEASSGDIRLGSVNSGSLDIRLSSGDLVVSSLDSTTTGIRTSGDTDIKSARGAINLSGTSGEVNLGLAGTGSPVELSVSSGDVTLEIPSGSGFDVKLKASSGRIRSDFPVMGNLAAQGEKSIEGTVNGGGVPIAVTASSGNITLKSR